YTLVLDKDCDPQFYSSPFIRDFLSNGGECVGNEAFGILSPVEAISTLKGDCDTRALLLATVLKHYGIDAAVLSSELYSHAMLGVALNYRGESVYWGDTRYVTWETTAKGIRPGIMSPDMGIRNAWEVNQLNN